MTARVVSKPPSKQCRVVQTNFHHSCDKEKRRRDVTDARELAVKRLGKLGAANPTLSSSDDEHSSCDDKPSSISSSVQPHPHDDSPNLASDGRTPSLVRGSTRSRKAPERYGFKKSRQREADKEDVADTGASEDDGLATIKTLSDTLQSPTKKRVRRSFPSKQTLHDEIDPLAKVRSYFLLFSPHTTIVRPTCLQSCPVSMPGIGSRFAFLDALLIHIHAYAAQNGFSFTRRCGGEDKEILRVECSESRHPSGSRKCRFHLKAQENDIGGWTITDIHSSHSHALGQPDIPPPAAGQHALNSLSVSSSSASGSASSTGHPRKPHPPRSGFPTSWALADACSLAAPPPPTTSNHTPATFPAFLLSLDPYLSAADLYSISTFYAAAGITTVDQLAEFVRLEDETVIRLVEGVREDMGWTAIDESKVIQAVRSMRERFGEGSWRVV
ncbi:hypothetical protein JCM11251_002577 [Rhodosporidiobolus azoricus]